MNKMRTAKSLKKPVPMVPKAIVDSRDADSDIQFELELCWCVHQLENSLNSGKLSAKAADDVSKNIKILKSSSAPLIKKRQLMKTAFGDYRLKMRDEEKKLALASKQIKFSSCSDVQRKSSFVKKSAILTSGKDFRFNFTQDSTSNPQDADTNKSIETVTSSFCINKDLELTKGSQFKFNFVVDEERDDLNLNGLSLKN